MKYRSDNTKYPDPTNFIEYLILKWNNIWDKEYQESKARYEKLHRHEPISKAEKRDFQKAIREQGKKMKKGDMA